MDGSVVEEAEVELFRWKDAQFLDSDRHWNRWKIKESLYINACKILVPMKLSEIMASGDIGVRSLPGCWRGHHHLNKHRK